MLGFVENTDLAVVLIDRIVMPRSVEGERYVVGWLDHKSCGRKRQMWTLFWLSSTQRAVVIAGILPSGQ